MQPIPGNIVLIGCIVAGAFRYLQVLAFSGKGYFFAGGIVIVYLFGYLSPVFTIGIRSGTPIRYG